MRNSTIATSRTRADRRAPLIDYRPLHEEWGDVASLRRVRAARRRARAAGADPSLVEVTVPPRRVA